MASWLEQALQAWQATATLPTHFPPSTPELRWPVLQRTRNWCSSPQPQECSTLWALHWWPSPPVGVSKGASWLALALQALPPSTPRRKVPAWPATLGWRCQARTLDTAWPTSLGWTGPPWVTLCQPCTPSRRPVGGPPPLVESRSIQDSSVTTSSYHHRDFRPPVGLWFARLFPVWGGGPKNAK